MRTNGLRAAWAEGKSVVGVWLSVADPVIVEALAGLGFDYSCLDLQHGLAGYEDVIPTLQAQSGSPIVPLARPEWNRPDNIGQLLDAGCMGVIVPMVNSASEAEAAAASCRYVPRGSRSYGPARASRVMGEGYFEEANDEVLCFVMVETVEAVANVESIAAVEGVDGIYIGPSDLAISMGLRPGPDHPEQEFQQAVQRVLSACADNGIVAGIHSTAAVASLRLEQGFGLVTVTSDLNAAVSGAQEHLARVIKADKPTADGMY